MACRMEILDYRLILVLSTKRAGGMYVGQGNKTILLNNMCLFLDMDTLVCKFTQNQDAHEIQGLNDFYLCRFLEDLIDKV